MAAAAESTKCLPIIIEEDEIIDDDFYEKIQAPKFVDLTKPDHHRRSLDDDRHWFCLRVGCDQRHEQEFDSEAIYKNFVLRVMAARSPNVRLRNAFNRREASASLKCPLTAPAKPRVSRMAFISSLSHSHKVTNNDMKVVKPLSKVSATPNAKVKQSSSVSKALTTPRNQNKVSNLEQFRSVQSKKATNLGVPKSRVVSKALVFHSPKKVGIAKSSMELKTSMKALCSAMKKLEFNGVKKNEEGLAASRKQFKGREVKSRVFDSLYYSNRKEKETNIVKCLKEKKVKAMQKQPYENESSDMETEEKSKSERDSLERWPEPESSEAGNEKSQESTVLVLSEASSSLSSSNEEEKKTLEGSENEEQRNSVSDKGRLPEAKKRKDEKNSMASDDKENEIQFTENDDKENASAPSENIKALSINNDPPKKAILGSKAMSINNYPHKKSTQTSTGAQVVKYRKLKPTNPKPFKFRTDERGVLKEANLEKKITSPLKETKAIRKHQNKKESCLPQTQSDQDSYSSCDKKPNQTIQRNESGNIQSDKSNIIKAQHKLSATAPHRNPGPKLQKPSDQDENFRRKSKMIQLSVVRPRSALSRKKEKSVCKLSVIIEKPSDIVKPKEAAKKPRKNDVSSPTSTATGSTSSSRPCSQQGRRALTVPKEPKFQSLHVPKSCTTKKPT